MQTLTKVREALELWPSRLWCSAVWYKKSLV